MLDWGWMHQFPGMLYYKDSALIYQDCSHSFAKLLGINSLQDIVHKTDEDFKFFDNTKLDLEVIQSKKCMQTQQTLTSKNNKTLSLLTKKIPILNQQQEVIGVLSFSEHSSMKSDQASAQTTQQTMTIV